MIIVVENVLKPRWNTLWMVNVICWLIVGIAYSSLYGDK